MELTGPNVKRRRVELPGSTSHTLGGGATCVQVHAAAISATVFVVKLLVFLTESFEFEASEPGSPLAEQPPAPSEGRFGEAIVAFVQCEPRDETRGEAVLKQAVKYFRWFARKRGLTRLVIHSFAHLADERSSPEYARDLLATLGDRLEEHGFEVHHTPFGWSLRWSMSVSGHGYAKTFKSL